MSITLTLPLLLATAIGWASRTSNALAQRLPEGVRKGRETQQLHPVLQVRSPLDETDVNHTNPLLRATSIGCASRQSNRLPPPLLEGVSEGRKTQELLLLLVLQVRSPLDVTDVNHTDPLPLSYLQRRLAAPPVHHAYKPALSRSGLPIGSSRCQSPSYPPPPPDADWLSLPVNQRLPGGLKER